jgi:hypothetical protein
MIEHAPMQLALPAAISSLLNAFGMEVHVFSHSPQVVVQGVEPLVLLRLHMWTCNFHFQTLDLYQCSNQTGAPSQYGKDEQNKVSPDARRA